MGIYTAILYFFTYAFIGWCVEVAYAAAAEKKFVNRGFLNGPLCPIYGFGVVAVIGFLEPFKSNIVLLYFTSMLLVTALEWLTGFILEKIFHNKWWDYSNIPFNLNGYVCLRFSLIWGVACVFVIKWVHPLIAKGIGLIPELLGHILIVVLLIGGCADLYVTVSKILKLNRRLEKMEEIAKELHRISDELGENIYKDVTKAMEKKEEVSEEFRERKEEVSEEFRERKEEVSEELKVRREQIHELRMKYHELADVNMKEARRLLNAFPKMNSKRYKEALQDLHDYLRKK